MSQSKGSAIDVNCERAYTGARFNIAYKQFDDLCGQFYHSWFRYHPEQAVDVGVYDYADLLTSYEHDDIGALLVLDQKLIYSIDRYIFYRVTITPVVFFKVV